MRLGESQRGLRFDPEAGPEFTTRDKPGSYLVYSMCNVGVVVCLFVMLSLVSSLKTNHLVTTVKII